MFGTVNTVNPEDVVPAGRSAWRKRSRLPTSSLPAILSLAPFIFVRGRKTCVDMFYIFFFIFQ